MQSRARKRKAGLIDAVVGQIHDRREKKDAHVLEGFVRQYYGEVAPEDLVQFNAENLYGEALSIWRFAQKRKPGEPKLRVYNPRHEEHGWQSTHTVVEIVNDDMPFLVDSINSALNRQDLFLPAAEAAGFVAARRQQSPRVGGELMVYLLVHPILRVRRDPAGKLVEVLGPDDDAKGAVDESILHVEVSQQSSQRALNTIRDSLARVLGDVRAAVADWRPALAKTDEIIDDLDAAPPPLPKDEIAEAKAFLAWIRDNNFTFLGYRECRLERRDGNDYLRLVEDSGLGVLRHVLPESRARSEAPLSAAVSRSARRKQLLIITKAYDRATVHRPVYMDYIGVRTFDKRGKVTGERRFVGLFTSAAYNRNPRDIPMLRDKVAKVIERSPFPQGSHNGKALLNFLETYPRDELFQTGTDDLYEFCHGILHLEERQRIRLFMRRDDYARFFSCLIYVKRDRYDSDLRRKMQDELLKALNGASAEYTTQLSEAVMARLHFIVHTPPGEAVADDGDDIGTRRVTDTDVIEQRLVAATRLWTDDLKEACVERWGEAEGMALYTRYQDAFPAAYSEDFSAQTAVADIDKIKGMADDGIAMNLYNRIDAREGVLHFKVYHQRDPVPLSDILPRLENMGLKVIAEAPYLVEPQGAEGGYWIDDFSMESKRGVAFDVPKVQAPFEAAFARIWAKDIEDDGFNQLVLGAGLSWREVTIIRAYCKFRLQVWKTFSQHEMHEVLGIYPSLMRMLIDLFNARFDPAREKGRAKTVKDIDRRIAVAIDAIEDRDEDRILRRFHNLIRSTLRTNYFKAGPGGEPKPYISLKLDSQALEGLPPPRPWVEIFVYSPRFEAVHLRGGEVARGGLRWSDRRSDFRTEVLGLMKAQMVKNAVIVPVGAKGGFVVKRQFTDDESDAKRKEGIACYKTFISGMLDITDNRVDGKVVPPPDVVRHDGDDPYLVVAADKGTAEFSDIANGVAIDYGFWLGDAFASGGSEGYDHKKMGITARGAWESVKRNFRELGVDTQTTDFTCVGIGDMGGDVFGNGMLLSEHIKLIGAFNKPHIFIDPKPDPATSFSERQRLFKNRLGWNEYDKKLISKDGGVFARSAKSVKVTPEMKAALGIDEDRLTPNELIRALLLAPVDLLWNGGIGTYVKARDESHAEVGDKENEAVRVDGQALRCRVVGEGGNLGFIQRGRIEFARKGGRVYSDAIDNSAGVDCSDHEVNIKVLLNDIVAAGDMTAKQRSRLLAEMTDEVGEQVLRDNYRQTQAINVALAQGTRILESQKRLMRFLEKEGDLKRALEHLPDDETLDELQKEGKGLTAPEVSVLLAYSKMKLYQVLLQSDLPEDPYLADDLVRYFPGPLGERFATVIHRHRLRREIIATVVTNSIVNRVGAAFVNRFADEHGFAPSEIARAHVITRDCYHLRSVWDAIDALDNKVPAGVQTAMLIDVGRLVERCMLLWFLRNRPQPLDIAAAKEAFTPGIDALAEHLDDVLSPSRATAMDQAAAAYADRGVPKDVADRVAGLGVLGSALDIVETATRGEMAVEVVGGVYFEVGERLGFDWLRTGARGFGAESHWQRQAIGAIIDDLYGQQRVLTGAVLAAGGTTPVNGAVDAWIDAHGPAVARVRSLLNDLRKAGTQDLAMLTVANRRIRVLAAG